MFRCVYVYEFSDNSAYIGLTYNLEKRNISRKTQIYDGVTKHISETDLIPELKQLSDYIPTNEASLLENKYIKIYRDNGWKILNKTKGGELGSGERTWTKELCQKEAFKFNSRSEFYYKNNKVYAAAQRYGWLNEICQHMNLKIHHWTVNECKKEALKYDYRYDFAKNNKAAYTWAIRHNTLNEVCSHMNCMIGTNQHKQNGTYSRTRVS
jgi:predicted GIY-YIG superfamily endonuclease